LRHVLKFRFQKAATYLRFGEIAIKDHSEILFCL